MQQGAMSIEEGVPQKQRHSWVEANPVVANFAASGVSVATGARRPHKVC